MTFLNNLFNNGAKEITSSIGDIIDSITVTDPEKLEAKAKISEIVLPALNRLYNAQRDVLVAEMQGNFLQKSWRPLTMLTFVCLLVLRWTGLSESTIPLELETRLMDIIELGLGGYVIGRSVENISKTVTRNIDLSFLKKKDRTEGFLNN
ncbi:MAG: 3TM-type holin [Mangrovibacterium sp.]